MTPPEASTSSTVAAVWSPWPWLITIPSMPARSSSRSLMLWRRASLFAPVSRTTLLGAPLASTSSRRRESPHWPRPPAWTRFSARVVTLRDLMLSISEVNYPPG